MPNEAGDFRQLGFRRPLANLVKAGLIAEADVFSLQWRIRNGGDAEEHRQDLISRIRSFRPNVVLMQHLGTTGLRHKHFHAMRKAAEFEFIYHEADPYSRFKHPLPVSAQAAGRAANVTFTVGSGVFADNFRRAGCADVRWAPHVFEPDRYEYMPVSNDLVREHDIVVVANRNSPRFRGHPNWRDRIKFVDLLQDRFGDRLAIYGRGWTGVGAMGPVEFSKQHEVIRSAWVSANWDHYAKEPNYFSNRLPISLASGSIHATTWHPGYDRLFPGSTKAFLIHNRSGRGLVDDIHQYLSKTSPYQRIEAGISAQKFAYHDFRQDDQLVKFLNYRSIRVDPRAASEAWDLEDGSLTAV
ncbi:hypothetical protein FDW83_07495 [Pseudarthrobacter sp. NamE2]|uniref:hypothetical protein n=1 Tax=Pseudarthrobacter sp. NamE2 TaxID=2576838 RepID=UPI0010FE4769|nr:hypothetical protein [Pseudarthrobacter sp. NamE2]TLM84549.1 hypothetical protein FDW83_07495 [Pseudarthrobacter sp. NamE2]